MGNDTVLMDVRDGVATVTLNRPDTHNAFDEHVIAALSGKLDALHVEEGVYAVVLRGAGKNFSAGADFNWMKRAAAFTEQQNKADAMALATMLHRLNTLPQVVIACARGAAMGGGLGLLACCDIVIARRDAVFATSEVKIGLIPATIGPYVIRAIGERQARRYFQTGEKFDGTAAQAIGLVHALVDDDAGAEAALQNFLDAIRRNGKRAMRESKSLILDLAGRAVDESLMDETARRIAKVRAGDEAREGLNAFLEKRPPNF